MRLDGKGECRERENVFSLTVGVSTAWVKGKTYWAMWD